MPETQEQDVLGTNGRSDQTYRRYFPGVAGVAIVAGQAVALDQSVAGYNTVILATNLDELRCIGVAAKNAAIGAQVEIITFGVVLNASVADAVAALGPLSASAVDGMLGPATVQTTTAPATRILGFALEAADVNNVADIFLYCG